MKETRREGGNLQHMELEVLMQRVEQMELQGQKKKELKTLKKIERLKAMLEQNKMDESQQGMEHLQGIVGLGKQPRIRTLKL